MAIRRFGHAVPPARVLVGMAAVLALLLGLVVTAGRAGAAADPYTVTGGHVDWGVKASFRSYVTGPIGAGSITTDGGATTNGDGTFRFPAASGTVAADGSTVAATTGGAVHFTGHAGQLDIDVWDVRVDVAGTTGTVVVDATSKPVGSTEVETYDDTALATLDLSGVTPSDDGTTRTWADVPATVHADGVGIFDNYPAGTALDPVTVVLELAEPATTTTTEAPTTTSTTVEAPTTTSTTVEPGDEPTLVVSKTTGIDPAGETVTVTGTGFAPDAHLGTRPPLAGQPSGVYVVFGRFAETWRPSEGAPSSARQVIAQKWALGASSRAILDPEGTGAAYVTIGEDGTFTTELPIAPDDTKTGDYAVATYPASGGIDAAQETYQAVSFASPTTTTTAAPTTTTTAAPTTTTTEAPPTTLPDGPATVTGGHLDWGVKQSFRTYVTGPIAGGAITPSEGTTANGDGTYRFPVTTGLAAADGEAFEATFGGTLTFSGHHGALDTRFSGLEVVVDGDGGALVADVSAKDVGTGETHVLADVELAELDLSGVTPTASGLTVTWATIAANLTEAGVPAFGNYPAGEALDALTVVLDVESTSVPPGTTPPTGGGAGDVATVDKSVLVPGEQVTVSGGGFLAGEQVEVWLHSTPQWVGTAVAGSDGSVSHSFALPTDLPAGQHHVELRGITSGRVVATAAFTVLAAGGPGVAGAVTMGSLPYTGSDVDGLLRAGAALVLAGGALGLVARRRPRAAS